MSEMISIKEAAERWKLTVRRVSTLCKEGKVEGAIKQKNRWMICHVAKRMDSII